MTDSKERTIGGTAPGGAAPDARLKIGASARHLGRTTSGSVVAALCCLVVVFDGYDVSTYGATVPSILKYPAWHASAAALGLIGSLILIGMLVGSLICGFATDHLGRKRMLVASTAWFSLCVVVCSGAPNLATFGIFRLLAGVGLGGVLPTVNAFAIEFAPAGRRNFFTALVNIGFALGTMVAAVLGIAIIPDYGFRPMYAIAALPLLLMPIAWLVLPESADFLAAKGRERQAAEVAERFRLDPPIAAATGGESLGAPRRKRALIGPELLPKLLLFGLCGICVQLVIYGLNTWLPQLMQQAGYPPTSALTLLATLSLGAVAGGLIMAAMADRIGVRPMTIIAFGIGALALAILSNQPPTALVYVAVALAGVGSNGTAIILYGYVGTWFPSAIRASALGSFITLARFGGIFAPLIGGWIIAADLPARSNFIALLIPAVLGALVGRVLPRLHHGARAAGR